MEERKEVYPPAAAAASTPQPQAEHQQAHPQHHSQRKRRRIAAPEHLDLQDSNFGQIRNILKDLRPAFTEVLKTPDYRNCKSATEICAGMTRMVELCKQLISETVSLGKNKKAMEGASSGAADNLNDQTNKQNQDICQEPHVVGGSPMGWNFVLLTNGAQASA